MKRRKVVYADDVIKMLEKHWMSGVYPNASDVMNLPSADEWKKIEKDGEPDTKRDVYITYTSGMTGMGWYDEYTGDWLTDRNSYRGTTPRHYIKAWTELPDAYEDGDYDGEP